MNSTASDLNATFKRLSRAVAFYNSNLNTLSPHPSAQLRAALCLPHFCKQGCNLYSCLEEQIELLLMIQNNVILYSLFKSN